ncbi:MAG: carboxypeptidase regulatory-like domain-containing protein [Saprospiraceae bacterium]
MMMESSVFFFKLASISEDTSKATLRVRVLEKGGDTEPIQGATVLLRRDKDKMLGRVTKYDGRCLFVSAPENYTIQVQMTGLKTFEKPGFMLEAGKVYDMEILMARN